MSHMTVIFTHTGRRVNQLFDIAEKHGVSFHGGHKASEGYALRTSGKITEALQKEIKSLPYVVRVETTQ